ncbi:MAG: response regulator transcription factor [Lachnospiraceae bacterium]|nr:response regulator transcription factor [Lachnospiraceae bacterium]
MDTKVIFISGYAEFDYARKALKMGASDYLLKPVEEEDLKEILEELILELDGTKAYGEVENVSFGIEEILLEIQKDCCEDITLKGLAEKYYISDSRLSVLLKERLGMSFPNYLASIRIKKAQELMKDERLSLEAIAKMVGFKDYFYFSKVFKKTEGISPGRFRKKIK